MALASQLLEGAALLSHLDALREQARLALEPDVWAYLEAGADDGISADEAIVAWGRLRLRPRILRGVAASDVSTRVLDRPISLPVMIAPNGRATRYAPDGEAALIGGAARAGTITVLPSSVVPSLAALRRLHPGALLWQQLYPCADRAAMADRLGAIRSAGCAAIVLTVDLMPGDRSIAPPPRAAWESAEAQPGPAGLFAATTIDDLAWLCGEAGLPVVVKGVLRGDDAELCIAAGAAGLIVSNHGGNQLDTAIASDEELPEIVAAASGRAEIYVDGGIRRGTSILKALALSARAVLVGRPASHALAAGGADGVAAMLGVLKDELERAMALCGAADIAAIDRSLVSR